MRDSSLEDFVGDDTADGGVDADTDTEPADDEPVTPAVSTYEWTPTGAECPRCGTVVERRWRDEAADDTGELVCFDCKVW
jgi:hypothetical protein